MILQPRSGFSFITSSRVIDFGGRNPRVLLRHLTAEPSGLPLQHFEIEILEKCFDLLWCWVGYVKQIERFRFPFLWGLLWFLVEMNSGDQSGDRSFDSLSHFSLLVSFQLARNANTMTSAAAVTQLHCMRKCIVVSMIVVLSLWGCGPCGPGDS